MRACPHALQIQEESVCSGRTTVDGVDQSSYRTSVEPSPRGRRLLIDIGQGDLSLITGSTQVRIFPEGGRGATRPQLLAAFSHLRRVGSPHRSLPTPALPRKLLRELKRTERAQARYGSTEAAARRLGTTAERVRQRLRLARTLATLPRVRAISCPRR